MKVISHHFLTYLLHGTKVVRLAKLQEIASYLDSGAHLVREGRVLTFKPEAKEFILKIWNSQQKKNSFFFVGLSRLNDARD